MRCTTLGRKVAYITPRTPPSARGSHEDRERLDVLDEACPWRIKDQGRNRIPQLAKVPPYHHHHQHRGNSSDSVCHFLDPCWTKIQTPLRCLASCLFPVASLYRQWNKEIEGVELICERRFWSAIRPSGSIPPSVSWSLEEGKGNAACRSHAPSSSMVVYLQLRILPKIRAYCRLGGERKGMALLAGENSSSSQFFSFHSLSLHAFRYFRVFLSCFRSD